MPRTPTTPTSKTKGRDVLSASPSKQPRGKKEPVQVQDRSQWRASRIRPGTTINKGRAKQYYRLLDSDLEKLSCEDSSTVKKFGGTHFIRPMYLYNEREVELKAWEKHGGPEGFERMLVNKRAIWDKQCEKNPQKAEKPFPQPDSYRSANAPSQQGGGVYLLGSPSKNQPDFETSTPALLRMKHEMTNAGALWLWDIINEKFIEYTDFDAPISGPAREKVVTRARSMLSKYPRRPTSRLPATSSFDHLRDVLQRAPVDVGDEKTVGLEVIWHWPEGEKSVNWATSYFDDVYDALIQIIEEHGVEGWCRARWLVYDKYLECEIGYFGYDGHDWDDTAEFWLDSRDRRLHPNFPKPSALRRRYHQLLANVNPRH